MRALRKRRASPSDGRRVKRADWLYLAAAFAGLGAALAAALGLAPGGRRAIPAAAYVNGEAISQSEYARALSAMQAGLERPLTVEDRERALQVLIDEELIVQEAVNLGLASSDRLVRKNIVQAMMRAPAGAAGDAPDDAVLRAFYGDNAGLFSAPVMLSVEAARAPGGKSGAFEAALKKGAPFNAASAQAGFELIELPQSAPPGKIADYLGGAARDALLQMQPGEIAGPVESAGGDLYLWLKSRDGGAVSFGEAREDVLREWRRREEERALADYVANLRRRARIKTIADPQADE